MHYGYANIQQIKILPRMRATKARNSRYEARTINHPWTKERTVFCTHNKSQIIPLIL